MSAKQPFWVSPERPFPGLRPFSYQDHAFFFGRDEQTFALYRLIDRNRFIAVIGGSGSGKSSLVRAGLRPQLELETRETGGRTWRWFEMRPGDAPLRRLTNAIANLAPDDDPALASARRDRIAAHLRRSSVGLAEALGEIEGLDLFSNVLVVDQFEELFRYATSKPEGSGAQAAARDEAAHFIQLLLEATRARTHRIHVLITMRSDFIGDCARFYDLPEAVSATQFLVPALTRDQLDQVIRNPVEKAGAGIEPELVERLLNDCSTEPEQLPVLQHCLLRLWDEAGRTASRPAIAPTDAELRPAAEPAARAQLRHLTLDHYRAIGGFADALSLHADEILKGLPGSELQVAVEQTFRALCELDKQGRATRRALPFARLLAETGVEEGNLRRVLDRFRSDDCSFLLPPAFEEPTIEPATRVDVGHEALLRRWEKVSGHGADVGWLRSEQADGERYRGLLAMAESDKAALPPDLVAERWAWWNERPRTAAWAERYGGGFGRVQRLLRTSQSRRSFVRVAVLASLALAVAAAVAMTILWHQAKVAKDQAWAAENNTQQHKQRAQHNHDTALTATLRSTEKLIEFVNEGQITIKGAQSLLEQSQYTLTYLESDPEAQDDKTTETATRLLLTMSDVRVATGDNDGALALVRQARDIAKKVLARSPDDPRFQHILYGSTFRIGDAISNFGDQRGATAEYDAALDIARALVDREPDNPERRRNLAFILNKVGDMHMDRREWAAAILDYLESLNIVREYAEKDPDNTDWPRDVAIAEVRLGQVLVRMGDFDGALRQYRHALAIQKYLSNKEPGNNILLTNQATTERRIGQALMHAGNPAEALAAFEEAIEIRAKLRDKDPGNAQWQSGLAFDHANYGDVLVKLGDWSKAEASYRTAVGIREGLVFKDPDNPILVRALVATHDKLRTILIEQDRLDDALSHYQETVRLLSSLAADSFPRRVKRNLFVTHLTMGDLLLRRARPSDALAAYRSAVSSAKHALVGRPNPGWTIRLSSTHEKIGDILATMEGTGNETRTAYETALAVISPLAARQPNNDAAQRQKQSIETKLGALEPPRRAPTP